MQRKLTIYYEDNSNPASQAAIILYRRGEKVAGARLDHSGRCKININEDWIDKLVLNGATVKEDWDIGNKKEIEVWVKRPAGGGGERKQMTFRYGDGSPIAKAKITLYRSDEVVGKGKTDSSGRAKIAVSANWVDRIEADGTVVAEDVDMEKKTFEFSGQRADQIDGREQGRGFFNFDDRVEHTIRGRVYLPNGRVATGISEVKAMTDAGTFTDNNPRDGWFLIQLTGDKTDKITGQTVRNPQLFIDGQEPKGSFWDKNARIWTVMHASSGGFIPFVDDVASSGGGGLITGRAVNSKGQPLVGAKVSADLGNSMFDMMFDKNLGQGDWASAVIMGGPGSPTAQTNKNGFFTLHLPYGEQAKKLFVDGDEPTKIVARDKTIPNKDIRPGSFNLELWAPRRVFRDMLG